ncbi:MAG: amino acid ABC transporter ATP-binding protein [Lachnospiraceae bacterium]|nr:amino acid ABC transporter ATP-binding protein [Lachnospiraceae bacterium]
MELFKIENCRKSFDGKEVLKGISMSVDTGEVVSVIGPSGSGKSTLLRCACMLETMDGGNLIYEGKYAASETGGKVVYAKGNELKEIRKTFGLVFQNFNLFPHYSVLKNITEPMMLAGSDKKAAEDKAMEVLGKLGLSEKVKDYPCNLSGGQQQRVSIARALALEPKILFFDEPTSALDPELTGEVLKVIRDLAAMHMTMIIVTHEMNFARDVSDRMIFMEDGLIRAEGTPDELFNSDDERLKAFMGRLEGR